MTRGSGTEPQGEHVHDELSTYIDGLLGEEERMRVRAHLDTCSECRSDYMELRSTQQMLRALPVMAPPRAFTLVQETVASTSGSWLHRLLIRRNVPRLATGSVLAFALMILLVVAQAAGANSGANETTGSMAMSAGPPSSRPPSSPLHNAAAPSAEAKSAARPTAPAGDDSQSGFESATPTSQLASPAPLQTTAAAAADSTTAFPTSAVEPTGGLGGSGLTQTSAQPTETPFYPQATAAPGSADYSSRPSDGGSNVVLGFEVALGLLGLLLGAGALVARGR